MRFPLRVHSVTRDTSALGDDQLGEALVELVRGALARRSAPTVATITRDDRIEVIALQSVVEHHVPLQGFIASLTRADFEATTQDARAVGLMGTVHLRRPDAPAVPMAVVFLEWPDCRWWHWRALLDPSTGEPLPDTETVRRAVDGDALPDGLGRWWSLGRRQAGRVRITASPPPVVADSPLVH
jgi:hypothetical protein